MDKGLQAQFLTPLFLQDIDGQTMEVIAPLVFLSLELHGIFRVPKGFVTDFASVPRGLWNLWPRVGKYSKAAVLHDASYRGDLLSKYGQRVTLIRPLADRLFLEAMRASGVGAFTARVFYLAVRAFGEPAYRGLDHLQSASPVEP